jgi:hypothetical protein
MWGEAKRRIGAHWPALLSASGALLTVVGWILDREMSGRQLWCEVSAELQASANAAPATTTVTSTSCRGIDILYNGAQVLLTVGVVLLVVGVVGLVRRAPAAWRAGNQRRVLAGLATCVVVLAAVWVGPGQWDRLSAAFEAKAHRRGQAALAELKLPAELRRQPYKGCVPSPDLICATSSLPPDEVEPLLRTLLNGTPDEDVCRLVPVPQSAPEEPCPVKAILGGQPARASASHHVLFGKDGPPPAGATPLRAGRHTLFTMGSDVRIALVPRI